MEIKEHAPEKPMHQRRTKKVNKKISETNTNENTTYQIYGMLQKQLQSKVLEQSSRAKFLNAYIKKQEIYATYISIKKDLK